MDELEISGKRYISTRRAAREHGYHSDYMGQLIRGKKVAGQKVGRAWYIDEDSLNAYLGHEAAPAPKIAVLEEAPAPVPAPIERLVVEEPAPVQPVPEVAEAAAVLQQAEPAVSVELVAVYEPVVMQEPAPEVAQTITAKAEPVQEIHHAFIEEHETRIPIHTQSHATQETGGLRYTADDSAPIPVVSRMPQAQASVQQYVNDTAHAQRKSGTFPYISLSVVGVVAILATAFASNFVSATIVSEEGKAATVQYAIHW